MIRWAAPFATAPVAGRVRVPGSKSASARSLVLAALAEAPSTLTGILDSRDTTLMRAALAGFGTGFEQVDADQLRVTPATSLRGGGTVECGLAGTVLRFVPPIAALTTPPTGFRGDAAAAARPVAPLLDALESLGAEVSPQRSLPFTVGGGQLPPPQRVGVDAGGSSQFISALLLVAARFPRGLEVVHTGTTVPSLPHIEMTCTLLRRRGVQVTRTAATTWKVEPGPIRGLDETIEPDLTNAASLLASALITGGAVTTAWPRTSVQAGDALLDVLRAFGAQTQFAESSDGEREVTVSGPAGVHGATVDLHDVSELTPVAAALAAVADSPSRISGVAHIRGHETDRLAALATELDRLGVVAAQTPDGLEITPGRRHGSVFHTYADHRLAHAAALIGLVTEGVELDDVGCTTKTLPDFVGMWAALVGGSR